MNGPAIPLLEVYPKEIKVYIHKKAYVRMWKNSLGLFLIDTLEY